MINNYEFDAANVDGNKEAVVVPNVPTPVNKLSAHETNGIKDKINELVDVANTILPIQFGELRLKFKGEGNTLDTLQIGDIVHGFADADTIWTNAEYLGGDINDRANYLNIADGGGAVITVTGDMVDNTDPLNPIVLHDETKLDKADFIQTTAGVFNRINFTGDTTAIAAGTFYLTSATSKGVVANASPTPLVNDDNQKKYFAQDLIGNAFPAVTKFPAGIYAGHLTVRVSPNSAQQRYTVEIYKTNNGGTPIASGITGAPTGSLGVTVIAILDSGNINLADNALTGISLSGALASELTINTGERIRYHVSAEKVGTASASITMEVFYGSNYNSYYDVPVTFNTSLNQAYGNGPAITTTTPLGPVTIKRGSAADTDNILVGQNGAGTNTFSVLGNGITSISVPSGISVPALSITGGTNQFISVVNGPVQTILQSHGNNAISIMGSVSNTPLSLVSNYSSKVQIYPAGQTVFQNGGTFVNNGTDIIQAAGTVLSTGFKVTGATGFLKSNGTVDTNTYAPTNNPTFTGSLILAPNPVGVNSNIISQVMADTDFWRIYGTSTITEKGTMVFEVGDNGGPIATGGQSFEFRYNNTADGTAKTPLTIDYNEILSKNYINILRSGTAITPVGDESIISQRSAVGENSAISIVSNAEAVLRLTNTASTELGAIKYNTATNAMSFITNSVNRGGFNSAGIFTVASPDFTGVPTAPTATAGTNTTQIATTAFVLANAGGGATSGTYTPTISGLTNLSNVNGESIVYTQIGNIVTGTIRFNVVEVALSSVTSFKFTLPINRTTTSATKMAGSGVCSGSNSKVIEIRFDATNNSATVRYKTDSTSASTEFGSATFQYSILD